MKKLHLGLVVLLSAFVVGFFATPANALANSGSAVDPAGDASAATEDIVNLSLDFDLTTVTIEIELDSAPPAFAHSSWSHSDGDGRVFAIGIEINGGQGLDDLRYMFIDGDGANVVDGMEDVVCAASPSLSTVTLTVSFAASCIGTPGDLRITAITGELDVTGDNGFVPDDIAPADGFDEAVPLHVSAGGYWLLGGDGGVFSFGGAEFYGSTGGLPLNAPVVGMSAMPTDDGYRFVASDGGVFSYGSAVAHFHGSMGGQPLNKPVVGMATTPSGDGYWLVASDGGVFSYGDADFYGSMGGKPLNEPIVGIATTTSGNGYYLVAEDGGIFAYGDAEFYGSAGGISVNEPFVGIEPVAGGYYLLGADGGVFGYGASNFYGSGLNAFDGDVVAMEAIGNGYYLIGADGTVKKYGAVYGYADLIDYGVDLNEPLVGAAAF